MVLAADVNVTQLDALIGIALLEAVPCFIMALGQQTITAPGGVDPIGLTMAAHGMRGARAVNRAQHLVPVGRPYAGQAGTLTQTMALQLDFLDGPSRMVNPPA